MNEPRIIPGDDNPEELDTDLLLVLEDVLLHIDELHHQHADTTEIAPVLAYASQLRAKLS